MAKQTLAPPAPISRWKVLLTGAALGFAWGSVMWLVFQLTGQESGLRGWLYIAITTAMIGIGVSAIFGASMVRKRGERVAPEMPNFRRNRRRR